MRIWPGRPYPLGATWDGAGVNFALFSEHATKVELCLFDSVDAPARVAAHPAARADRPGLARLSSRRRAGPALWLSRPRPVRAGQGTSVQSATRSCSIPTPRPIGRDLRWDDSLFGYKVGDASSRTCPSTSATAPPSRRWPPSSIRPSPGATTGRRASPWHKTLIYELHVKGFTQLNPDVPEKLRGTYAGLASEAAIQHLQELGVTAVELLPVHHFLDDRHLVEKGRTNYWGYNTLAFFAPDLAVRGHDHSAGRRPAVQDDGPRRCTPPASR